MDYFVTGATGLIGRFLVSNLLKRKGTIHGLVRKGSEKSWTPSARRWAGTCSECSRWSATWPRRSAG